ncbi:ABC transporter ATP-binding protein [Haloarcula nitratireducens]|uniref:Molybdate/tungstate import ATP-binding protein WtpC n=1 Tax=Haloarcula nitratireducens TaxID=2487749 RepID=A0AAW4PHN0_9EURY|nr:ABC transporter ATP-binding protein [Halomicroarcula nitratireducens]MBX0297489.1 ABC transporter ATP-binding protein [Halomicroarcula nitratireducens]
MSYVEVENITKRFDDVVAVDDVSFTADKGEFVSLLGPSGCGKTTTLRMIAGLEMPSEGTIRIDGEDVTDRPAYEREIGMVFQHYALFPHKTVGENIGFPLKMRGVPEAERRERVADVLERVRLPDVADRSPEDLSGGQQQRVALARALVFEPDVLLMDEPLSALDRVLREQMRVEVERIQREFGITTIYVTHDQAEAFAMSDRVAVLDDGHLSQQGRPLDIYENPDSEFVANFIGQSSQLSGQVSSGDGAPVLATDSGMTFELPQSTASTPGDRLSVFLRAEKLNVSRTPTDAVNEFPAEITTTNYLGEKTQFFCRLDDGTEVIVAKHGFTDVENFEPGDVVYVSVPPENLVVARDPGTSKAQANSGDFTA